MRSVYFLVFLLSIALVVDVEAGWKFWKKDKTTTETPPSSTTIATISSTTAKTSPTPTQKRGAATTPPSAKSGVAALADPALAIGVGNTGSNIRDNARNQPRKPNPGTDVGLDIGQPKPVRPGLGGANGQGYRDWAADLTGAGESGRLSPKLPDKGPALSAGGQAPGNRGSVPGTPTGQQPGSRPASVPGTPTGHQPAVTPTSRPASVPNTPTGHQPAGNKPGSVPGTPTGQHSTFSSTPTPTPAARPGSPTPAARPGSPTPQRPNSGVPQPTPQGAKPGAAPTNGPNRSWADVAGGGSFPSQPSGKPTPQTPPNSRASSPIGNGGAAATGALAGAGVVAAATTGGKTFSSNPTYSKGNAVTDEDLEKLSEALFIKDVNNANKYITLNLQKTTSSSSPKDEAPQPLFSVKPEALQIATIQKVLSIYDNYKLDSRENEYISPAQRQEESLLVDTFLSTNVMSTAMRFLADKGFVKKDYYEYKDTLRTMWFNLYSRGEGKIGSTGFEHVFMTELKLGTEVSGLHNWIYFNAEELNKRLDYLGYMKKVDLGNKAAIVKLHSKFNGIDKPTTTIFVGTSPELEMALYTVCFYARPDAACPVSLGGTKFNIITHKFKYRGKNLIGSAYPEI